MEKGEQAELICRSDYAYGEEGSPPNIPPNATLHFDVELVDWSVSISSISLDETFGPFGYFSGREKNEDKRLKR